jgi:hypothetical protein
MHDATPMTKDRDFSSLDAMAMAIPLTRLPFGAHAFVGWERKKRISESVPGLLLLGGWASFGVDCAAGTTTSDSSVGKGRRLRRREGAGWMNGQVNRCIGAAAHDDGQRALVGLYAGRCK